MADQPGPPSYSPGYEPDFKCGTFGGVDIPAEIRKRMDADRAAAEAASPERDDAMDERCSCGYDLRVTCTCGTCGLIYQACLGCHLKTRACRCRCEGQIRRHPNHPEEWA